MSYYLKYKKYKAKYTALMNNIQVGGDRLNDIQVGGDILDDIFVDVELGPEGGGKVLDGINKFKEDLPSEIVLRPAYSMSFFRILTIHAISKEMDAIVDIIKNTKSNFITDTLSFSGTRLKLLPEHAPDTIAIQFTETRNVLGQLKFKLLQNIIDYFSKQYKNIGSKRIARGEQYKNFKVLDYTALRFFSDGNELFNIHVDEMEKNYYIGISNNEYLEKYKFRSSSKIKIQCDNIKNSQIIIDPITFDIVDKRFRVYTHDNPNGILF
jgi:hypothetical protein